MRRCARGSKAGLLSCMPSSTLRRGQVVGILEIRLTNLIWDNPSAVLFQRSKSALMNWRCCLYLVLIPKAGWAVVVYYHESVLSLDSRCCMNVCARLCLPLYGFDTTYCKDDVCTWALTRNTPSVESHVLLDLPGSFNT